ncbi:DUF4147 domain-containing protein [Natrarchaeobius halalkaliphilus]|uniref:DUF4147 domain-containing protein n=1 Tax=Natrarchaeobius halalkaliphilus TaxID=1679091 RepID=A0A3N6LL96_9EURY|nr:DUF4147 domain-containing protein [Natrarchaeobius halalkaliphilus]RQG87850.1 DUF4147 domain-containing protein [Natrarchaeobius halalkaliphilus]
MADIENRSVLSRTTGHETALACLEAGIEAAHPDNLVAERLSLEGDELTIDGFGTGRTVFDLERYDDVVLVGGGNAASQLASAVEDLLGERIGGGAVVTDDPVGTDRIDVFVGDHPVPSRRGVRNADRVLELAQSATEDDLVIACLTGGGSALLPAPVDSISLSELQTTTDRLLASGATIHEINAVRKHCSLIKGGQLARGASPATVVGLVVSDVVGDDPSVVASGPTVPDSTTYEDAIAVFERYDLDVPDAVWTHLRNGLDGSVPETPGPDDPLFERVSTHVLGNNRTALDAAAEAAAARGYEPVVLSSRVRGEAREAALTHVAIAEECRTTGDPVAPPAVFLSGGETTVTLGQEYGTGGPNQEFVLSAAVELELDGVVVAAVDTDGIDGATDAAGAIADASSVDTVEGRTALESNDSTTALSQAGSIVRTGQTGTNVNDLRVFVVDSNR